MYTPRWRSARFTWDCGRCRGWCVSVSCRNPEKLAGPLAALKRRLGFLGSDRGGMLVTMEGVGHNGQPRRIDWHLVAGSGHGPFIPADASGAAHQELLAGTLAARGAMPCIGPVHA